MLLSMLSRSSSPAVCVFGFDEPNEGGRTWAIRTGLKENGAVVKPCRTDVKGFFAKWRDLYRKWNSLEGDIHAVYVVFMGSYLMPLVWYLARRRGSLIILDMLISQYDTEVGDRKRLSRFFPRAWFLWLVDFSACHLADAIVVDTFAHKEFFHVHFFINPKNIIVAPIGCRSDLFKPAPVAKKPKEEFIVEFHGTFIPLQGIEHIVEAAKILQDGAENIRFVLVGVGQMFAETERRVKELRLSNIELVGRKPPKEIPQYVAEGDVCLGIFGATEKALRVIPNKVYECLSAGKAVITERSPAALETLRDGKDVRMVEPADPHDLAEKILELKNDPALRSRLGRSARAISLERFSPRAIARPLLDWLVSRV